MDELKVNVHSPKTPIKSKKMTRKPKIKALQAMVQDISQKMNSLHTIILSLRQNYLFDRWRLPRWPQVSAILVVFFLILQRIY